MRKLNKAQLEELAAHKLALDEAYHAYKEAIENAKQFADEVVQEMREYHEGKSEAWRDGEKGTAYESWIDSWDGFDFEEPTEIDLDQLETEFTE